MSIIAMYTTTSTRLFHTNNLVFIGLVSLLMVFSVRMLPLGFIRLITLVTLVTLIIFPLIHFLRILGIGHTL